HVRFTPESGHSQCTRPCVLWAKSGHQFNFEGKSSRTLYAIIGRPFKANSPTGSTVTAFSTFVRTRGLIKICRLCFIAEPRRNIGYRADGGIIEASLETDGAERGKPVCNADAETNVVPPPMPSLS